MKRRLFVPVLIVLLALAAIGPPVTRAWRVTTYAWLPIPQFTDDNGNPCATCKLYSYVVGTDTAHATYSDSSGTPNVNPVTLDAAGRANVFLERGQGYKLTLKTAAGVTVWTRDGVEVWDDVTVPAATVIPPGLVLPYGGTSAPAGWLLCNGAAVSRTTYAALFAIVGTTFGTGDGSTTFNLPDMRGKYPFGMDTSGTGNTLGGTFGTKDHVHTGPSHTHALSGATAAGGNAAVTGSTATAATGITTSTQNVDNVGGGAVATVLDGITDPQHSHGAGTLTGPSHTHDKGTLATVADGTGSTGTGNPPSVTVNFIIKQEPEPEDEDELLMAA